MSVPVFLSQTEGICVDLLGVGPFTKDTGRGVLRLQDAVSADDRLTVVYRAPLVTIQPVAGALGTEKPSRGISTVTPYCTGKTSSMGMRSTA